MKRILTAVTAAVMLFSLSLPALASLVTYTSSMSGFTHDSDVVDATFNAALGLGYDHINFLGASNTNGASYSPRVTFSTKVGVFGGSNTGNVNAGNEIGPSGTWDGILNIDFLANGYTASAVGFGLVEFNNAREHIRIYDATNTLIGNFNNQLGGTFSLWGVSGAQIGRIELDGNFFAIQDIEFQLRAAQVPEPSSLLLAALGLFCLGALRLRRNA